MSSHLSQWHNGLTCGRFLKVTFLLLYNMEHLKSNNGVRYLLQNKFFIELILVGTQWSVSKVLVSLQSDGLSWGMGSRDSLLVSWNPKIWYRLEGTINYIFFLFMCVILGLEYSVSMLLVGFIWWSI